MTKSTSNILTFCFSVYSAEIWIDLGELHNFFDFHCEIASERNIIQDALDWSEELNLIKIVLLQELKLLSTGISEQISDKLSDFIKLLAIDELLDVFSRSVNECVLILGRIIPHKINQSLFVAAYIFKGF